MAEKATRQEMLRALKFTLFSISAGIVQMAAFALLQAIVPFWSYAVRYLISLVLSVVWNFTFNRKYTFRSACNVPVAMAKVLLFYALFTPATMLLGAFLTDGRFFGSPVLQGLGWNDFIAQAINMILNFVLEYLYDRFFVFADTIDTGDK